MWIVRLADDSHEIQSLNFLKKNDKKVTITIFPSALMVNKKTLVSVKKNFVNIVNKKMIWWKLNGIIILEY